MPDVQALFMTVIIVGSILLTPQMIKLSLDKGGWRSWLAVAGLSIVFVVSALFSMMTTIGTLYNNQSREAIISTENTQKKAAIESGVAARRDRLERLTNAIDMAVGDEQRYTARIDLLLGEGVVTGQAMATLVANRNKAQTARRDAEIEVARLIEQVDSFAIEAGSISAERTDFITWIADRFQWTRDLTELIMSAVPAIFVDVLAPSMLMVVLFL